MDSDDDVDDSDSSSTINQNELQHVKILGNVNIVLTTILFVIIFIFLLSNYTSFRRNRSINHFPLF